MHWIHFQTNQLRGLCTYFLFLTQIFPLHYERLIFSIAVKEGGLIQMGPCLIASCEEVISKLFFLWHPYHRKMKEAGNKISYSIMDLKGVSWTLGSRYLFNTQRTMSPLKESKKIKNDSPRKNP